MVAALALALLSACGCPTNASGVAASAYKYETELDAACAAVSGCERDFMDSIRVYEAPLAELQDVCGADKNGCMCEGVACASILVTSCVPGDATCEGTQAKVLLHEAVHAAYASVGVDTRDHGPLFEKALAAARTYLPRR